jgi:nitroimidazol reductase NimA-like FMN-containing flavoprotein (pyridoxamine 5'-phosphate oxidase superfamily)
MEEKVVASRQEGMRKSERDSTRTRLRSHPERSVPEEVREILSAGHVAHLGFVIDGQPFVIPMSYHFEPRASDEPDGVDRLYLHGSTKGRAMQHLSGAAPVCVAVTHLDHLVYSRTALDHSMNYRSVVCFGRGRLVEDAGEKARLLERMVRRYFPGREEGVDYEAAPAGHLTATALVEVTIEEASAKARRGGPNGPLDDDPDALGSAGLIEI